MLHILENNWRAYTEVSRGSRILDQVACYMFRFKGSRQVSHVPSVRDCSRIISRRDSRRSSVTCPGLTLSSFEWNFVRDTPPACSDSALKMMEDTGCVCDFRRGKEEKARPFVVASPRHVRACPEAHGRCAVLGYLPPPPPLCSTRDGSIDPLKLVSD